MTRSSAPLWRSGDRALESPQQAAAGRAPGQKQGGRAPRSAGRSQRREGPPWLPECPVRGATLGDAACRDASGKERRLQMGVGTRPRMDERPADVLERALGRLLQRVQRDFPEARPEMLIERVPGAPFTDFEDELFAHSGRNALGETLERRRARADARERANASDVVRGAPLLPIARCDD